MHGINPFEKAGSIMDINQFRMLKQALKKDFEDLYKNDFPEKYNKSLHKRHMEIDLATFENLYKLYDNLLISKD